MSYQLSKRQFWYVSAAVANCWIDDHTARWWAKSRPHPIATGLAKCTIQTQYLLGRYLCMFETKRAFFVMSNEVGAALPLGTAPGLS